MIDKDNSTEKWECPFCKNKSATIVEDAVLRGDFREILCECTECTELYIRRYTYTNTFALIRN